MRALVLIVLSVLVLASIQAGYLIVEARRPHRHVITDDAHQQMTSSDAHPSPTAASQASHAGRHAKKIKHESVTYRVKTSAPTQEVIPEPSTRKPYYRTPQGRPERGHSRICRDNPELCHNGIPTWVVDVGTRNRHQKPDRKPHQKMRKPFRITIDQIAPPDVKKQNNSLHHYFELKVDKTQELSRYHKAEDDSPLPQPTAPTAAQSVKEPFYDLMMGDDPVKDPNSHPDSQPDGRRRGGRKKKGNKKGKKHGHQKKDNIKEKKRNKKRKPKGACETDSDCGEGACCLERRSGRRSCRPGHVTQLGARCLHSCMCAQDLKCFVSEVNKRGKKKKIRPGRRVVGTCINPTHDKHGVGFYLPKETPSSGS